MVRCIVFGAVGTENEHRFVLVQRAHDDPHAATTWEIPGGKVERDQTYWDAARDEIQQETGLAFTPLTELTYTHSEPLTKGKYEGYLYEVTIGAVRANPGDIILSEEHDDSMWTTYEEALKQDLKPEVRYALMLFHSAYPQFF